MARCGVSVRQRVMSGLVQSANFIFSLNLEELYVVTGSFQELYDVENTQRPYLEDLYVVTDQTFSRAV